MIFFFFQNDEEENIFFKAKYYVKNIVNCRNNIWKACIA